MRYTPPGGVVIAIFGVESTNARVCIKNPGPPIPQKHIAQIFERSYRPDDSRQRSGAGAGLGLAIVKSIVEAHGGTIIACSTVKGTTFMVLLPSTKGCARGSSQN